MTDTLAPAPRAARFARRAGAVARLVGLGLAPAGGPSTVPAKVVKSRGRRVYVTRELAEHEVVAVVDAAAEHKSIKAQIAALEAALEAPAGVLKAAIGTHEGVTVDGIIVATYTEQERTDASVERVRLYAPAMYSRICTTTTYSVLRVK